MFCSSFQCAVVLGVVSVALIQPGLAQQILPAPSVASGSPFSFAPVVERVSPGVVGISVGQQRESDNPLFNDPAFRRFFEDMQKDLERKPSSGQAAVRPAGSGVVVDATRGLVLTNHHVVQGASRLVVSLKDRRELVAELVGSDPGTDLAVLRIKPDHLTAVPLGNSDAMRIGDFVVAIGNPFGLGQTVTSGIVSAMGRGISPEGYEDYIQTDAAINPGNSGGALINLRGELIGINAAILSSGRSGQGGSGGNIGIGFAVPTSMAREIMGQIVQHGEVRRGRIGVQTEEVTEEIAKAKGLPSIAGAFVRSVVHHSSAEQAGILADDVVSQIDGRRVHTASDLRNRLALIPVGGRAALTVWRGGQPRVLHVFIEAISAEQVAVTQQTVPSSGGAGHPPPTIAASSLQGMQLSLGRDGLVVRDLQPGSPAHAVGFRSGDVILGVNREVVSSVAEFNTLLARSGIKVISVLRGEAKLRFNLG